VMNLTWKHIRVSRVKEVACEETWITCGTYVTQGIIHSFGPFLAQYYGPLVMAIDLKASSTA
jgi:hypothetical protein